MGFNATVVVLLDRLSEIERDPEFGRKLADAIRYNSSFGNAKSGDPGYRVFGSEATGQTQVIEVHHADYQSVVTVGGNTGRVLGWGGRYDATDDEIIREIERERRTKAKKAKEPRP